MAELKIDPFRIDINLMSSVDLQKQLTSYVELLIAFPDETAANSMFWHTDAHSDPISSKIDFFKLLNSNELKVSGNADGSKKIKTTEQDLKNKNIRDQIGKTQHVVTDTGNKYGKPEVSNGIAETRVYKTEKTWKENIPGQTHENANGEWVTTQLPPEEKEHPVVEPTEYQNKETTLQEKFGMKDMSAWFMLWWIEKFNTTHPVIKDQLINLLGEDNEYFVKFSESVGQLKNYDDAKDTSTLPINDLDVSSNLEESVPNVLPGIAKYCTKPETESLAFDLSRKTNKIYRNNMFSMCDNSSKDTVVQKIYPDVSESHGCNLIQDFYHPYRMLLYVDTIREQVQSHLKGLYDVLELLSDRENHMVVGKPKQIIMKVEQFTTSVNLLKNKIRQYTLTDTQQTLSRYGKPTAYNNQPLNAQILAVPGVTEDSLDG